MRDSSANVLSLRLFGSHARGEADEGSDIDVLLVLDDATAGPPLMDLPGKPDISIYSRDKLEQMFREGHLFAWHLFLESIPYCSTRSEAWFRSLGKPAEYREAQQDIAQFMGILEEALAGMASEDCYVFEAGVAHLAMRNLGMILGYIHRGTPNFCRYAALQLPKEIAPEISHREYEMLLSCRRASVRGDVAVELPSFEQIQQISLPLKIWLKQLRKS